MLNPPSSTLRAGAVIGDKYRLIGPLDRGVMATVWRAEHLVLRAPVAVKLIQNRLLARDDAEEIRRRFLREAQAAAAVRSPHVVQILDYGIHEDCPFIVLELLDGESLRDRLKREQKLSFTETRSIVSQIGRALAYAHELGVVHRDLKPANVFLVRNGEQDLVKILDFGTAKLVSSRSRALTPSGIVIGTPYYMSPEQINAKKDVDWRTDLWSLGIIAFECLCGARPFQADSLLSLMRQICREAPAAPSSLAAVPPGMDEWFSRATCVRRSERFQSAKEMIEALPPIAAPEPVRADEGAPSAGEPTTKRVPEPVGSDTQYVADVDVQPAPRRVAKSTLRSAEYSARESTLRDGTRLERARERPALTLPILDPALASPTTASGATVSLSDSAPLPRPLRSRATSIILSACFLSVASLMFWLAARDRVQILETFAPSEALVVEPPLAKEHEHQKNASVSSPALKSADVPEPAKPPPVQKSNVPAAAAASVPPVVAPAPDTRKRDPRVGF